MWRRILFAIICSLSPAAFLFSQDTGQNILKWDLETCLEYAKRNNIQINTNRLNQKLSEQDLYLARA